MLEWFYEQMLKEPNNAELIVVDRIGYWVVKPKRRKKMPLTAKGKKVKRAMAKTYGAKKGKKVFYASINAGKVTGAEEETGEAVHKTAKKVAKKVMSKVR